jgi:hypothetical protein
MSRERITSRDAEAADILKAVEVLEKSAGIQATDDASLKSEADKAATADKTTVNESVPAGKAELKDNGDQNAKANANWPVADKQKVAASLIALAKQLLDDDQKV